MIMGNMKKIFIYFCLIFFSFSFIFTGDKTRGQRSVAPPRLRPVTGVRRVSPRQQYPERVVRRPKYTKFSDFIGIYRMYCQRVGSSNFGGFEELVKKVEMDFKRKWSGSGYSFYYNIKHLFLSETGPRFGNPSLRYFYPFYDEINYSLLKCKDFLSIEYSCIEGLGISKDSVDEKMSRLSNISDLLNRLKIMIDYFFYNPGVLDDGGYFLRKRLLKEEVENKI